MTISSLVFPVGPYSFEEGNGFFKRDNSCQHKLTGTKGGTFDVFIVDIHEWDVDPQKCLTMVAVTVKYNGQPVKSRIDKDFENNVYVVFIYDVDEVVSNDFTI